jgi:chemotaxis signal transduction protein
MSYCLFHSGPRSCAVRQAAVKEVLVRRILTPLPLAPAGLEGLAALRGEPLPVFRVSALMPPEPAQEAASAAPDRILVLEDGGRRFGILVDKVEQAPDLAAFPRLVPFEEGELSRRLDSLLDRREA